MEIPARTKAIILESVSDELILTNAARRARVTLEQLKTWLSLGHEDVSRGFKTDLGEFYLDVMEAQGDRVKELLLKVSQGKRGWKSATWILERCLKEDFGTDSTEYKDLLELYTKLRDDLKRLTDNPLQGVTTNGREMDFKGD